MNAETSRAAASPVQGHRFRKLVQPHLLAFTNEAPSHSIASTYDAQMRNASIAALVVLVAAVACRGSSERGSSQDAAVAGAGGGIGGSGGAAGSGGGAGAGGSDPAAGAGGATPDAGATSTDAPRSDAEADVVGMHAAAGSPGRDGGSGGTRDSGADAADALSNTDATDASVSPAGFAGCQIGALLESDDFASGTGRWVAELETPAQSSLSAKNGKLDIDSAGGATIWFMPVLDGDIVVDYRVTVVVQSGANDHLTDLNSFWMATDPANSNLFTRSGKFAQYDTLYLYYVGFGGNGNTTTRFRRYDRNPTRPDPLAEYTDAAHLLVANREYHIQHVVCGNHVSYIVDGDPYFQYDDSNPYRTGRFAFRTVGSHESIRSFSISRLQKP
jgi:rhamnogalacturonan endolyase